jgi:hypothetical protein
MALVRRLWDGLFELRTLSLDHVAAPLSVRLRWSTPGSGLSVQCRQRAAGGGVTAGAGAEPFCDPP